MSVPASIAGQESFREVYTPSGDRIQRESSEVDAIDVAIVLLVYMKESGLPKPRAPNCMPPNVRRQYSIRIQV